mgnify:CR=1 FL=1|jgi:hypothetical protein
MTNQRPIKTIMRLVGCMLLSFILTGCAHRAQSNPQSNYDSFLEAEQRWFELLFEDNMEGALEMVSDNYGSEAYTDKAALAKYMKLIQGNKMLTRETLDRSQVKIDFNDTTANAGPYLLSAHGFSFSFSLDYTLEDADWKITGMNWAKQ